MRRVTSSSCGLCGFVVTASAASAASSAGRSSAEASSLTTGLSARRQNVQFQPAAASSGSMTPVMWPPKKTSPRAPFTIAWYAMNRSCGNDGNRGTRWGLVFVGSTPLHAICNVIQNGFRPAASRVFRASSPTTLMSRFEPFTCSPGGYETG